MPCFRPLKGWRSKTVNPKTGLRPIVWKPSQATHVGLTDDGSQTIPCGQCRYCRLEHSRQWAIRATHEAQLYDRNCFLTLTYAPEYLPKDRSIDESHPKKFMNDLRGRLAYQGKGKIRSYGCAEYGEKKGRPHYHLCLFNHEFEDQVSAEVTPAGHQLYESKLLDELWPYGRARSGALTFESAGYVARYVTKKINVSKATPADRLEEYSKAYEWIDEKTGEVFTRLPERPVCVSRMPGIGRPWLDRYLLDVYPSDFVVVRGRKMRPPKYYDRIFSLVNPQAMATIKSSRKEKANEFLEQETLEQLEQFEKVGNYHVFSRLSVLEEVQELKYQRLERSFENGKTESVFDL